MPWRLSRGCRGCARVHGSAGCAGCEEHQGYHAGQAVALGSWRGSCQSLLREHAQLDFPLIADETREIANLLGMMVARMEVEAVCSCLLNMVSPSMI